MQSHINNPKYELLHLAMDEYGEVVDRAIRYSDVNLALHSYQMAGSHLFTQTKASIQSDYQLTLNGAINFRNGRALFVSASTADGMIKVVKIPYSNYDISPELHAIKELALDNLPDGIFLVPSCEIVIHPKVKQEMEKHVDPLNSYVTKPASVIAMNYYSCDLCKFPYPINDDVFVMKLLHLIQAVSYIHSKKRVHMDIKCENIFVCTYGQWFLGDFGSCVAVDSPIQTYTPESYPFGLVNKGNNALYKYDWIALGVTMAVFMNNQNGTEFVNVNTRNSDLDIISQYFENSKLPQNLKLLLQTMINLSLDDENRSKQIDSLVTQLKVDNNITF